MIIVDPESIGCGRKVPPHKLSEFQRAFELAFERKIAFQDFGETSELSPTAVTSIDRTVRFCDDYRVYVEAAVAHAVNDVLCGGADPLMVSASIGFTRSEVEGPEAGNIVSILGSCLAAHGLMAGKFHSFVDIESNLTISVLGARGGPLSSPELFRSGSIYLSKPVGAFKAAYLSTIRGASLPEAVVSALTGWSRELTQQLWHGCVAMSDVSGFGLVNCVDQLLINNDMVGEVDLSRVPLISLDIIEHHVDCLLKGKGYKAQRLSVSNSHLDVGSLTEVNGPIVIFGSSEIGTEFAGKLTQIGTWTAS